MSADDHHGQDKRHVEEMLRAEIRFWREMIDSCNRDEPTASVERMNQAKALAEFRLATLSTGCPERTSGHPDNPIH